MSTTIRTVLDFCHCISQIIIIDINITLIQHVCKKQSSYVDTHAKKQLLTRTQTTLILALAAVEVLYLAMWEKGSHVTRNGPELITESQKSKKFPGGGHASGPLEGSLRHLSYP